MDSAYFRSYEGRDPYLFISYAHRDSERVVPLLQMLKNAPEQAAADAGAGSRALRRLLKKQDGGRHYRIWYDEGIDAGSEWPENIERHMLNAAQTIVFWSEASRASRNCYREMVNAIGSGKPVLFVRLDDTPLPDERKDEHIALDAQNLPVEDTLAKICAEGRLPDSLIGANYPPPPPPVWPTLVLITVLLGALVAGAIYLTRQRPQEAIVESLPAETPVAVTPAPVAAPAEPRELATFTNPVIENNVYTTLRRFDLMPFSIVDPVLKSAIYERLQLPEDAETPEIAELAKITQLYICGDMIADSREDIAMVDGEYFVDGEQVSRGNLIFHTLDDDNSDYRVIACMTGLTSLSLCYQRVTEDMSGISGSNIESLSTLPDLEYLDISGNAFSSASFFYLWDNRKLKELNVAHTNINSIIALDKVPSIEKVYISRDMIPQLHHSIDGRIRFDVIVAD